MRASTDTWNQQGSMFSASGPGDWNLNMGGSGTTTQSANKLPSLPSIPGLTDNSSNLLPLLLIGVGAWLLLKKK